MLFVHSCIFFWELSIMSLAHFLMGFFLFFSFFKLYFRFWGTCADHAGLLHRYIHSRAVCCLHPPITYIWYFSLRYPSPLPTVPLAPLKWLQCVMLPSLCPHVLIVQHPPMSENVWFPVLAQCLVFCSCVSLLRMMFFRFIYVATNDTNSSFLIAG